jgi:hypothetical protein
MFIRNKKCKRLSTHKRKLTIAFLLGSLSSIKFLRFNDVSIFNNLPGAGSKVQSSCKVATYLRNFFAVFMRLRETLPQRHFLMLNMTSLLAAETNHRAHFTMLMFLMQAAFFCTKPARFFTNVQISVTHIRIPLQQPGACNADVGTVPA